MGFISEKERKWKCCSSSSVNADDCCQEWNNARSSVMIRMYILLVSCSCHLTLSPLCQTFTLRLRDSRHTLCSAHVCFSNTGYNNSLLWGEWWWSSSFQQTCNYSFLLKCCTELHGFLVKELLKLMLLLENKHRKLIVCFQLSWCILHSLPPLPGWPSFLQTSALLLGKMKRTDSDSYPHGEFARLLKYFLFSNKCILSLL